ANGDGVRVDTWRFDGVALRSAVPRRGHDDQTAAPRDFHGRRHRVEAVGEEGRRAKGEIDDADVVVVAVRENPLDSPHHGGDPTAPGVAEHTDTDDVGLRSDADNLTAGTAAVPSDDPRDMRPVPPWVARQARIREVDRGEETVRRLDEVRIRRDAGIEDRDGHACPVY